MHAPIQLKYIKKKNTTADILSARFINVYCTQILNNTNRNWTTQMSTMCSTHCKIHSLQQQNLKVTGFWFIDTMQYNNLVELLNKYARK